MIACLRDTSPELIRKGSSMGIETRQSSALWNEDDASPHKLIVRLFRDVDVVDAHGA